MRPYIKGLYKKLADIQLKIKTYQANCQHQGVVKTPRADTGNYDPNDDRYWYNCTCKDCNKFWTEDQ